MLSTCNDSQMLEIGKTDRKTGLQVKKPACFVDYNKSMGAVDKNDMLLTSVECVRRTTKWYKKIFFNILDTFLLNAYNLFQDVTKQKISLAKFQLQLVEEMIEAKPREEPIILRHFVCVEDIFRAK
jgi:hypothetical protein